MKLFVTSTALTFPDGKKQTVSDLVHSTEEIGTTELANYVRAAWESIGVKVAACAVTMVK